MRAQKRDLRQALHKAAQVHGLGIGIGFARGRRRLVNMIRSNQKIRSSRNEFKALLWKFRNEVFF